MQAVEAEQLSLDDEINDILPFKVINPHFPNAPITIRHLATHTSGIFDTINDNRNYIFSEELNQNEFQEAWFPMIEVYNQNESMPMVDFLQACLAQNGKWYKEHNFLKNRPGTNYEYSNIAIGPLAHILEISTDENYQIYTQKNILQAIGMNTSTWKISDIDSLDHVIYYNENYNPVPSYYCLTYPDGGLYSSVSDLTLYLQEIMKAYELFRF